MARHLAVSEDVDITYDIRAFSPRDRRVEDDASHYPQFHQDRRFKNLQAC